MRGVPRLSAVLAAAVLVVVGVPGSAVADNPRSTIDSPTSGAGLAVGVPVLVTGGAVNGEAGGVTSVEISLDRGLTWHETDYADERFRYVFTPGQAGVLHLVTRASTDSTVGSSTEEVTVVVGSTGALPAVRCECDFWFGELPGEPAVHDPDQMPVEVGLRTRFDRRGSITGAALLRGDYTGPVVLRVWSGGGSLLAEKRAGASMWSQWVRLDTPVPVVPDVDYVVSYYTPDGGYMSTEHYFEGVVVRAPFIAPHDGARGAGVYHYGLGGGFPTDVWRNSNYWVQPLFKA